MFLFFRWLFKVHLPLNEQSCRRLLTNQFPVQEVPASSKKGQKVSWLYLQESLIENKVLIIAGQSSSPSRSLPTSNLPLFCLPPPSLAHNCEHIYGYHQVNQLALFIQVQLLLRWSSLLKSPLWFRWLDLNLSSYHCKFN